MNLESRELGFTEVDDLAFAMQRELIILEDLRRKYVIQSIGPLFEMLHVLNSATAPRPTSWLDLRATTPLVEAMLSGAALWIAPNGWHMGYVRVLRDSPVGTEQWTGFLMKAQIASERISKLPKEVSGKLVAAIAEMESNIQEHSERPQTGFAAYLAIQGEFEFVVADRGIGILASLRRFQGYGGLSDEGAALRAALTDGVSRFGTDSGHGHGFRPLFTGLANLNAELRFRSGDHAITMDGTGPSLNSARLSQKAQLEGFFASVKCRDH